MKQPFTFRDGYFDLRTQNKDSSFFYRITTPQEVWGNYHAQIAFYSNSKHLIYHRRGCYAHFFLDNDQPYFVKWSSDSQFAIFYEYRRGPVPGKGVYDYVMIDFKNERCYRINLYQVPYQYFDDLSQDFDSVEALKEIKKLNIKSEPCYKTKRIINPIRWIFGIDKWSPI